MNLKDLKLSKIINSQKDKYCMILLRRGPQKSQIHTDRKENDGFQRLRGEGNGGYWSKDTTFTYKMKRFWESKVQCVTIVNNSILCT